MTVDGRIYQTAFLVFLIIALTGCGGPSPIRIKGSITTSQDVNPDAAGQPSPVVIRIYQLRSAGPFMDTDFFELYENGVATLGENLITWEELLLQPGVDLEYNTKFDPETKYLGLIVGYRDIENARWRELVTIPDKRKVHLYIQLDSLAVSASTGKR